MAVNSLFMNYYALKQLMSSAMITDIGLQEYKQQVVNNMAALNLTWFQQPCATPLTEWIYILAQPHVFKVLSDIHAMLSQSQLPNIHVYPQINCIFRALAHYNIIPENVKCVILCQDPYPNEHAMGLCLSAVQIIPPSLRNFFQVIYKSYGFDYYKLQFRPPTGNLEYLAMQGVLLLNCALTVGKVEQQQSMKKEKTISHVRFWKPVIEAILTAVYEANPRCAFLAMGIPAEKALLAVAGSKIPGFPAYVRPKIGTPVHNRPKPYGPFWCEMHPSAWIKLGNLPAAQNTFDEVRKYLNQSQNFLQPQWFQGSNGLWQYQFLNENIHWMPYLLSPYHAAPADSIDRFPSGAELNDIDDSGPTEEEIRTYDQLP